MILESSSYKVCLMQLLPWTTACTWQRCVICWACTRLCLACVPVSIFLARVVLLSAFSKCATLYIYAFSQTDLEFSQSLSSATEFVYFQQIILTHAWASSIGCLQTPYSRSRRLASRQFWLKFAFRRFLLLFRRSISATRQSSSSSNNCFQHNQVSKLLEDEELYCWIQSQRECLWKRSRGSFYSNLQCLQSEVA